MGKRGRKTVLPARGRLERRGVISLGEEPAGVIKLDPAPAIQRDEGDVVVHRTSDECPHPVTECVILDDAG